MRKCIALDKILVHFLSTVNNDLNNIIDKKIRHKGLAGGKRTVPPDVFREKVSDGLLKNWKLVG